jgi:hypothetical protein
MQINCSKKLIFIWSNDSTSIINNTSNKKKIKMPLNEQELIEMVKNLPKNEDDVYDDDDEEKIGTVYCIILREFINSQVSVCKIGRTKRSMHERMSGYPTQSEVLTTHRVMNIF